LFLFDDLTAEVNTFITNVDTTGTSNETLDLILALATK